MSLPQNDEVFKALINDIVCPILEASRKINDAATYSELMSQLLSQEMLACSFVQNSKLEVKWDIDEVLWFELMNQSKFQVIQDFSWLAVPVWVIESVEGV